ncbi:acyltransferase domain-containing protein, partial [Streptomyces sp. W16]|uniref:acyltransferase domain-containing protein n=1 Tax=Streptomyces sp. W16 TaxID=3076631 RepID=UPI00295C110E
AAVRRGHYQHRAAVLVRSADDIARSFADLDADDGVPAVSLGRVKALRPVDTAFVFSGRGPQWPGMGRGLARHSAAFRDRLQECDALMRPLLGVSVSELVTGKDDAARERHWQPVLFAFQASLTAMWQAVGITPSAVVGHSVGEVAAAYAAGVLTLEDAVTVICARHQAVARAAEGTMGVVALAAEDAEKLLAEIGGGGADHQVWVAAVNSGSSTVLAGTRAGLDEVHARLAESGVDYRAVDVDFPSHSPLMAPAAAWLRGEIAGIRPHPATVPLYSTVTGTLADGTTWDVAYWADNLTGTVRFADALRQLRDAGTTVFLEIGPHPVLVPAVEEENESAGHEAAVLASARRDADTTTWLGSLGDLYCLGADIHWEGLYPSGNFVPLPGQPWQRERFWLPDEAALDQETETPVPGSRASTTARAAAGNTSVPARDSRAEHP